MSEWAPAVTITVLRDVDGTIIDYVRECTEEELDGVIAAEQDLPGTLLSMGISAPE